MAQIAARPNGAVDAAAWFECDLSVSACLTRSALEQIFRKIPDGLYELICHPGEDDAGTRTRYSHWGYRWAEELEALTAPEMRVFLKEQGIALTSFVRSTGNRCNAVFT